MSLEAAIAELTAAVKANTAALLGKPAASSDGAPAPAADNGEPKKRGPGRPPKSESAAAATGYTAKHDKSEMQAVLNELREAKGVAAAKEIIKTVGKAEKMVDINDPKTIDAVYEAAKKELGGDEAEGEGDDDI